MMYLALSYDHRVVDGMEEEDFGQDQGGYKCDWLWELNHEGENTFDVIVVGSPEVMYVQFVARNWD